MSFFPIDAMLKLYNQNFRYEMGNEHWNAKHTLIVTIASQK